jgi:hypothetical protein
MLKLIFNIPPYLLCDYKNYNLQESYFRSKYLARKSYEGILPDYARLKKQKTSYASMSRKIVANSKKDIIHLFYDMQKLETHEMDLIDQEKFKKHLIASLVNIEDPNNYLGSSYQYMYLVI